MGVVDWAAHHWLDLLQSAGIIGGLFFTAISLRIDARVRRVANLLTLTGHHRDIWTQLYRRPQLARILDSKADLDKIPVTDEEELFVLLLVLHLSGVQEAMKQGMFVAPDGLRKDIQRFFSRPIPKAVWARIRLLQDQDFVRFVEAMSES